MRYSWFHHFDLTNEEANQLITAYQSRNVKTQRTLSADPRLWVVSALLPEYASELNGRSQYQQRIWG